MTRYGREKSKLLTIHRTGWAVVLAGCLLFLGGCGKGGENTALGMEALKGLDYQKALEYFDLARAAGESNKELARAEGIAYMGMTQYSQAALSFLEALGYSDGWVEDVDYDINFYLAAAYTKEGRLSEAEEIYSAILDLQPSNEDALFLRGNARMGLDNYTGAKEDFDKVIAMDGKNFDRLIQIYEVLHSYGYKEMGQVYLRAAMDTSGEQMSAYDKGRMYYYLEDYDNARNYLEKARKTEGYEAVLLLGQTYEELGDYNYAISVYSSFIEGDQTKASVYNRLGLCKMEQKAYDEALTAFQAGMNVENCTIMQTLKFNEIVTYERLGQYQTAASLLNSYLTTYPDDAVAQREYTFLKTR